MYIATTMVTVTNRYGEKVRIRKWRVKMKKAIEILNAGAQHMRDRAAAYDNDDGEHSIPATVSAFNAVTGHQVTQEQGWLFMALLKAVRSQQGCYKLDNYEDGASYFALAGEQGARDRADVVEYERQDEGWSPWEGSYNWVARDEYGAWYAYKDKPHVIEKHRQWDNSTGNASYFSEKDAMNKWAADRGITDDTPWQETLIGREPLNEELDWAPWEDGYKWVARDKDGDWYTYEYKPSHLAITWNANCRIRRFADQAAMRQWAEERGITDDTPWRKTLVGKGDKI